MDWYIKARKKFGKPKIWVHPLTGDYRIPAHEDQPMPDRYKIQGYEERTFSSYHEHAAWCRSKGLVNHYIEGIREDQDALGVNKWGY